MNNKTANLPEFINHSINESDSRVHIIPMYRAATAPEQQKTPDQT